MSNSYPRETTLDDLAVAAAQGDPRAEATLFASLRERFLQIAKWRVNEAQHEDIVQDALRIVHEKYAARPEGRGVLVWSLVVLRNVIGNHYQAERRDRERGVADGMAVLERAAQEESIPALGDEGDAADLRERLMRAIAELGVRHPRCAGIFNRLLAGLAAEANRSEINDDLYEHLKQGDPELSRGSWHVILHRCRARLRNLLSDGEEERYA